MTTTEDIIKALEWVKDQTDHDQYTLMSSHIQSAIDHLRAMEWCFDMNKAPYADHHLRGLWVNHKNGTSSWEEYYGYVHDERGDFMIAGIDEPAPWGADDFVAFIDFNPIPPSPPRKKEE